VEWISESPASGARTGWRCETDTAHILPVDASSWEELSTRLRSQRQSPFSAHATMHAMAGSSSRFHGLGDVAEILNISVAQVYALVRRGELPAIKIGGRGQWRVEHSELENYIDKAYQSTKQFIHDHPYSSDEPPAEERAADQPALET
jgi:excisionase family DNA binding protein